MSRKFNEEKFIEKAAFYLKKCRPGDWEHAKRVVRWVKKLGKGRSDLRTIVIAAYIHDIGWYELVDPKKKLTKNELKKVEPKANEQSEKLIREILSEFELENDEIESILRLVNAADKHSSGGEDEAIIVDADNLSKLCIEHVFEKYDRADWMKMLELWKQEFPKRIKTKKGLALYQSLLQELETDIEEESRFTAIGLIKYAFDYQKAYTLLQEQEKRVQHLYQVKYYLVCHSIELVLKAFLRMRGYSRKQIIDFGHDLESLLNELYTEHSLFVDEDSAIRIKSANKYYSSKQHEYPRVGMKELPSITELSSILDLMIAKADFQMRRDKTVM